jgi:hypothetical protein
MVLNSVLGAVQRSENATKKRKDITCNAFGWLEFAKSAKHDLDSEYKSISSILFQNE